MHLRTPKAELFVLPALSLDIPGPSFYICKKRELVQWFFLKDTFQLLKYVWFCEIELGDLYVHLGVTVSIMVQIPRMLPTNV